jgi:hypothetical protein
MIIDHIKIYFALDFMYTESITYIHDALYRTCTFLQHVFFKI